MGLKSLYEDLVLQRLIRCACGGPKIMDLRRQVVPLAEGRVFELGVGGGLNQRFYDPNLLTSFAGIDPSETLLDFARTAARDKGWETDMRLGFGEAIPFADNSFDTVVSTYTLCSVDKEHQVLAELRRVLSPGGRLIYLEHGQAPDPRPAKWQRVIEPAWKRVMGNCHLTRPVADTISRAGFDVAPLGQGYLSDMPKWVGWMEWGTASKSTSASASGCS